jgi:adenosine kinase
VSVLICGSLAYDIVMVLDDKIKFPKEADDAPAKNLDVYFYVPDLKRNFAGCAGNIAYSLKLLEQDVYPLGTVGSDFNGYMAWLKNRGISGEYIKSIEHSYTAQTYITCDMDDNKITAFHPGAMNFSHFNRVPITKSFDLGVIASDGEDGMQMHAQEFVQMGLSFLFAPGHSIYQMLSDNVLAFVQQAQWVVLNQAECEYLMTQTGMDVEQLASWVTALVINKGRDGATIYNNGVCYQIAAPKNYVVSDISGCDDAFTAGLIYALKHDIDWETSGRLASLMWTKAAEQHGSQYHQFNLEQFKQQFKQEYGYMLL